MPAYSSIDRETLKWVRTEVEATVNEAKSRLQNFVTTDQKASLLELGNHLHQVVGSMQMLELKSLSSLMVESEHMVEDFLTEESVVDKLSLTNLLETSIAVLESSLKSLEQEEPEDLVKTVELINQIRSVRGMDAVEISSLFSPMIDVFPKDEQKKVLSDEEYKMRSATLRIAFQSSLLDWLRDGNDASIRRIRLITDKLFEMSAFGAVARLWWVASAYADYVKHNTLQSRAVHGRLFRNFDDLLRNLGEHGESALVRNPRDELVKIMLFYIGSAEVRTERMDEIVDAFKLFDYFPDLKVGSDKYQPAEIESQLHAVHEAGGLQLPLIRQLVTSFFEEEEPDSGILEDISEQITSASNIFSKADIDIATPLVAETLEVVKGLRIGSLVKSEEIGFHLAAAIMFIEGGVTGSTSVDEYWVENGLHKIQALTAINNHEELTADMDGSSLTGGERQALLDVVGSEVEENLKHIESSLEDFSKQLDQPKLIAGIDQKIRQIRGALQVLGEQKVGLLLQLTEEQFVGLESRTVAATPVLVEALAISVGTMEEYVRGLQSGRTGMDYLLDRSITDLEVAIGKKVSRSDVESLLDESSDALFTWLAEQSDFELFTSLKSSLRDLMTLSRKTGLSAVEELVKEQSRLVDVISQEPAFLTGNITANLQNNMANIAGQIIQLYGTEDTPEELESEKALAFQTSKADQDDSAVKFHDDMNIKELEGELGAEVGESSEEQISSTEIGKQHAADHQEDNDVDDIIFEVFIEESTEIIESARQYQGACRQDANDRDAIRELRRSFHTLKGSARMVGLTNIGEVAWLGESLFNYILDTEKPLTTSILEFSEEALDEISHHLEQRYEKQHQIDIDAWGIKTEQVELEKPALVEEPIVLEEPVVIDKPEVVDELIVLEDSAVVEELVEIDEPILFEESLANRESVASAEDEHEFEIEFDSDQLDSLEISIESDSEDIDLSIESEELELDASMLSTDQSHSDEEEIEVVTSSFSVVEDPQMREVFTQEARTHLSAMSDELTKHPLLIEGDDRLSIAIHTLLGNARTLGYDQVAAAFAIAENLCLLKHESSTELGSLERNSLSQLLSAMHKFVSSGQNIAPYFTVDEDEWLRVTETLDSASKQASFELSSPADELSANSLVDDSSLDFTLDDDDLPEMVFDESIFSSELSTTVADSDEVEILGSGIRVDETYDLDEKDASVRVAAVFDELDPIDDLLDDSANIVSDGSTVGGLGDDLGDFELSLESMKSKDNLPDIEELELITTEEESPDIAELESLSPLLDEDDKQMDAPFIDGIAIGSGLAQTDDQAAPVNHLDAEEHRDSLIPDDLTHLIEDDLLTNEGAIFVEKEELEQSTVDNSDMPVDVMTIDDESSAEDLQLLVEEQAPIVEDSAPIVEDTAPIVEDTAPIVEDTAPIVEDSAPLVEKADASAAAPVQHQELAEDLDDELRQIFLDELKNLHGELDDEVAQLSSLAQSAPAMANIMRHLHTIKGSSLMAEARNLGELTHQTETFLESNFIRNDDDLRNVRKTLELYVDSIDVAAAHYSNNTPFTASSDLYSRLGVEVETPIAPSVPLAPKIPTVETVSEKQLDDSPSQLDVEETISTLVDRMTAINQQWKSARGWEKVKPDLLEQFQTLNSLVSQVPALGAVKPLLDIIGRYMKGLRLRKTTEFKFAKTTLEEGFDLAVSNCRAMMIGSGVEDDTKIRELLTGRTRNAKGSQATGGTAKPETAVYVSAANVESDEELSDIERQERGAKARAAALRIRTETLDSLTNYIGDASMNRSQMREDVVSIKGVVDDLYENVLRFSKQLRDLEIEADSKITSGTSSASAIDHGEEFDPLEMDRYTKLQQLSRGLAENLDELGTIQNSLSSFVHKAETSLQKQDRLNRELQDEIMQVRLVTFGGIGPQLRQVVRRTARELGKDVELELVGTEVRLDKTVLDGVVPALEHMLRNSVDHGIELPAVRTKSNKSKAGKIVVECRQVAREIIITVRDDGVGLDLDKIRTRAIEDNLLAEDQPLNPENMMMYISRSGFSTASKLTQISGRGVGMDVVQTTLRRMSGSIAFDMDDVRPGSSFTLRLPISLAVTSAVFVESGDEQFAIAARTVERVVNIDAEELIGYLKADTPSLSVDNVDYSLIDLAEYLGYETKLPTLEGKVAVILVDSGVQNLAVIVEELLDTQEIVVKNLGGHLGRIPIYAGATIRADGKVVLLIDLVGISYYESFISIPELSVNITQTIPNVMVVDDSLTVRKSAERDITALGINAVLAKDGLDAQIQLKQEVPDMILLDIEMPQMDGFELLEWLKSEKALKDVPVVMISSRATEKHINKATKLGCTAFLGKPYLLESLIEVFNQHLQLDSPITMDK